MIEKQIKNRGWIVTAAAFIISLALGILYSWSIFKTEIETIIKSGTPGSFDWTLSSINDPYSVSVLVFSFTMILAGKIQDVIGPKITTIIGGFLVSGGLYISSQSTDYLVWVLGFGVMLGAGVAFGYAAITPPALKWFPPEKTGLIAGIIVSGIALASVYIAPLSKYLISESGLQATMQYLSIAFFFVVIFFTFFIVNPPKGYVPVSKKSDLNEQIYKQVDVTPGIFLKTGLFFKLWFIYFIGAGVGLMVFSFINDMVKKGLGEVAFLGVVILAIGNAVGRVIGGALSDKAGTKRTLIYMFSFQLVLMLTSIFIVNSDNQNPAVLLSLSTLIGFAYGTNLAIFPSATKELYGLKNFGVNYGIMFAAWGLGGFVLSRVSQMLFTSTNSLASSFITASVLLVIGLILIFTIKKA
ncbi:MAG: OFA family MFS transporter [Ignavibacteria bacterium]|nr:OFA family MFS transporter [Ignavibacteria bacterium]